MTDVDEDWQDLVEALAVLGTVTETERGLVVELKTRSVEIVMTHDDWDGMPVWHGVHPIEETVALVRAQPEGMDFLVYNGQYQLVPSETLGISRGPAWERMRQRAAEHPDGVVPGAGWFTHKRDGSKAYLKDFEDGEG